MIKYLAILLCISGNVSYTPEIVHDIHVSTCNIEEGDKENEILLTVRIFYDDLLNAVGLKIGEELPENYESSDQLIEEFIDKNLTIEINGLETALQYQESVSYPPAVYTTLKIQEVETVESLMIRNTILIDLFDDQTNIINIRLPDKKKTVAMDKEKTFIKVEL